MTQLCTVSGSIVTIGLDPVAGATVTFTPLQSQIAPAGDDVVTPAPQSEKTAAGGEFSIAIIPGSYSVTVAEPGGWVQHPAFTAVVPEAATADLVDIMLAPVPPTLDAAAQAVADAREARDDAAASAASAGADSDAAASSASAAAASAGTAQAASQQAAQLVNPTTATSIFAMRNGQEGPVALTYNPDGTVATSTETLNGVTLVSAYTYQSGRLVRVDAASNGETWRQTLSYDAAGVLTSISAWVKQ